MRRIPKPIVAVVQGRALAGGCGLATACDLVLATESAKFGYPEVQRGFVPAIVMTLLKRTAGERSEEHTSELQSRLHLVCRLLLEKKKNNSGHIQVLTPQRNLTHRAVVDARWPLHRNWSRTSHPRALSPSPKLLPRPHAVRVTSRL